MSAPIQASVVQPRNINPYWLPPHLRDLFFCVYRAHLRRLPLEVAESAAWWLVVEYLDEIVGGPDTFERTADGEQLWRKAAAFNALPPVHVSVRGGKR